MIQQCQELSKDLDRTPTVKEFDKYTNSNCGFSVRKHFTSWNNFLKACGLDVNKKTFVTKEEMIQHVINLSKILGKTPSFREFNEQPDLPCALYTKKLFGSWNALIEAAGLPPNKITDKRKNPQSNADRESPVGVRSQKMIRFSDSEWAEIEYRAKEAGMRPNAYIRSKVLNR